MAKPTILVVEDEIDILLAIQDLLEREGYQVNTAVTGSDALKQVQDSHGYSAIILDLCLPDIYGLQVLQHIQALDATIPVIMLTARSELNEQIACLQQNAFAYLKKPYERQELVAIVQRAVAMKELRLKIERLECALASSEAQRQREQIKSQTLLLESEERLRLALQAGEMGMWEWQIPTSRIIWSREVAGLFGLTPESLEGNMDTYIDLIFPEDRKLVLETMRRTREEQTPYEVEYRIVWPSGAIRWMRSKGHISKDVGGHPTRVVGTIQDITVEKE